jgi:hypothetical protein
MLLNLVTYWLQSAVGSKADVKNLHVLFQLNKSGCALLFEVLKTNNEKCLLLHLNSCTVLGKCWFKQELVQSFLAAKPKKYYNQRGSKWC